MNFINRFKDLYGNSRLRAHINLIMILVGVLSVLDIYLVLNGNSHFIEVTITCSFMIILLVTLLVFYIYALLKNEHIKKLQNMKDEIEEKESRFRTALNNLNDVFWEYNINTKELSFSEKWINLTGYEEYEQHNFYLLVDKIVHPSDRGEFISSLKDYMAGKTPFFENNFRIKDASENYKWLYIKGIYQYEDSSSGILVGLISDITARKNIEEKLNYMAYYDPLTGLPNKGLFQNYLKESLNTAIKNNSQGAVIFLDIDDFKDVNDTLGHDYGDQLLKIISELLKVTLDKCKMISRIGGDEFVLLIEDVESKDEVEEICNKVIGLFKYSFEIGDRAIYSTVSIGVTIYPRDSTDLNVLFRNADTAMYKSKDNGKNRFCFFDSNMADELERKTKIGTLLREAIKRNELYIVYQPLYNMKTGSIVSMEALLRWNSKELGEIPPSEFIPVAENSGVITFIGRWVFEEVCKQNREWKKKGYNYKSIAVNISTMQIQDEKFVSYIKEAIENNGIEPSSIELEITETLLMSNIFFNEKKLHELKKIGVKIAIDDFGTGYSSLNYLTNLPLDTLKMDKAFIDNITTIQRDRILAENIIKLSHDLKIKVVAEGVESREQLDVLNNMNCDIVQGYFFSRPLLKDTIEKKLSEAYDGGEENGEGQGAY